MVETHRFSAGPALFALAVTLMVGLWIASGQASAAEGQSREIPLFKTSAVTTLDPAHEVSDTFVLPADLASKEMLLSLKARSDYKTLAGLSAALDVYVNGKRMTIDDIHGREATYTFATGNQAPTGAVGGAFYVPFAPNFLPVPRDSSYWPVDLPNHDPYTFQFRVTRYLKAGENTIKVRNGLTGEAYRLVFTEVKLIPASAAVEAAAKAAQAPLSFIAPKEVKDVPYEFALASGGALKLSLNGTSYVVASDYSLMPGWALLREQAPVGFSKVTLTPPDSLAAETPSFSLARKVTKHAECLEVADTLTNKTAANLPVMVKHTVRMKGLTDYRLSGHVIYMKEGVCTTPENPTTVLLTSSGALGMLPLDDVFRVHCRNFGSKETGDFGISDEYLVLKPGAVLTLRFALFPTQQKDYYSVINAMRRFLGANFQIEGGFCFLPARAVGTKNYRGEPMLTRMSPEADIRNFITWKGAKFDSCGREETYKGLCLNGPDWLSYADPELYRKYFARVKAAVPDVKVSIYFSNDFYALEDGKQKYAGCEQRTANGSQVNYSDPKYPLWLAVEGNAYANDLEKTLAFITDTVGTDGVYWDEFEHSAAIYNYGEPWDGVSADIDATTHAISRLKSSITLLTQPWRLKLVDRILSKGKYLIVNGAPNTEAFTRYKFPRFTETGGSATNCYSVQLYTPIALGNNIGEANERDCYRWMVTCLKYGCVYYWYSDEFAITHPTLASYMFPITPVELGEGYILAKERILTAQSGWFSFGDSSSATAHFYNSDGIEVTRGLPSQTKDGKVFYKVELGEHESCALVKK